MKVAIIDYGMGNVSSVKKALNYLKIESTITNDFATIKAANCIILPGVGAFPKGMQNLHKLGLVDFLTTQVMVEKKPFLGICLGMQLIASVGYEIEKTADRRRRHHRPGDGLRIPGARARALVRGACARPRRFSVSDTPGPTITKMTLSTLART